MKWRNAKNVFFDDGSFRLSNIYLFLTTTATTCVGKVTSLFYKQIHRLKNKFRNVQKKFDFIEVQCDRLIRIKRQTQWQTCNVIYWFPDAKLVILARLVCLQVTLKTHVKMIKMASVSNNHGHLLVCIMRIISWVAVSNNHRYVPVCIIMRWIS